MNWFLQRTVAETEAIADILEDEVDGCSDDGGDKDTTAEDDNSSEGDDTVEDGSSSGSAGSASETSGEKEEEEEDEEDEEDEEEEGNGHDSHCPVCLREDIDAANYEIGVIRQRLTMRIEALEKSVDGARDRASVATARETAREAAREATRVAAQTTATTMATLQAQAALRLELSRAHWDEIDREFAVETRRIFLGWLRATGAAPSDHRALRAVVDAMALTRRSS
jgi:hypothetical protein